MAITGINNSSCTSYYASNYKNTVKKTDSEKDSTNTKDGNVTTSTVELKTSRPGVTKTEQIKTGYSNVNDYSKYLQGKYHYMNTGTDFNARGSDNSIRFKCIFTEVYE
ncbi:MAG: hypothetical protein ACLRWA_02825 [Lachnospira sp.]